MRESTKYILKDIDKSLQICDAMIDMELDVLEGIDGVIRNELINDWFNNNWLVHQETLHENEGIWIYHKDLEFSEKGTKEGYIYISLQLNGNDPIWKLFGLTSKSVDNRNDSVFVEMYAKDGVPIEKVEMVFQAIDLENLQDKGFKIRKSARRPYLQKEISLDSREILNAITTGDWEDALSQLKDSWSDLVNLDWEKIIKIVKGT